MGAYGENYAYGTSPFYKDDGVPATTTLACNEGYGATLQPTTVNDIIKRALRLLGVQATDEPLDANEAADCLQVFNWMLDQWSNEKLMCYYMVNETFSLTAGKGTYTIGPDATQDFNTSRPIRIESAFARDFSSGYNNDYKLELIPNDRYQDIFQKGILTTYPKYINYVESWPYGQINIWPIPTKNYTLGLSQTKQLTKYVHISDIVCVPPGYKQAMGYCLAVEMAAEYGKPIDQLIAQKALETKANLKRTNHESWLMSTDTALIPRRMYNVYSDRY
jgi:hypothetical protein